MNRRTFDTATDISVFFFIFTPATHFINTASLCRVQHTYSCENLVYISQVYFASVSKKERKEAQIWFPQVLLRLHRNVVRRTTSREQENEASKISALPFIETAPQRQKQKPRVLFLFVLFCFTPVAVPQHTREAYPSKTVFLSSLCKAGRVEIIQISFTINERSFRIA